MFDRAKKLFDHAEVSALDKNELTIYHNAVIELMRDYQQQKSALVKKNLDAARAGLKECVDRLWPRYFPEDTPAPEGERFPNRKQALDWLKVQGYKISQGKFYQDCEAGFPSIHKDGSVSRYQVMQYAQQRDVERKSANCQDMASQRESDEARKIKADADKAEMQVEELRREQDARWLHRDEAWAQLAALIGTLRDNIRHQIHIGQARIIHLAGGDPTRGPEVYEGMEEILARAFNDVLSTGRIEGIFVEDKEDDAA